MRIYRPVKTNRIGQTFGQNLACETNDGKIISAISDGACPSGSVLFYPKIGLKGHNGYDLGAYRGEPIYHCGDFDGWLIPHYDGNGGIGVDVVSNAPQDLGGEKHFVKIRQWHLLSVVGNYGKKVKMGDLIGYADNTGYSAGDHDHIGGKKCDKDGNSIDKWNGYYGAFDITPYWENVFVLDVIGTKQAALTAIQLAQKVIFNVMKFFQGRNIKNG